ncbi:hypothetical protein PR001_g27841 [Phytophthora rubi]|uniref:Uncharacterized protein n=1 Tax=Phytophthora rubi TaxID=129364 RepID=A0A6A3HEC4_9STRA|nr:hypothetical protein PR001_g27841 [Phytophthora rubi]
MVEVSIKAVAMDARAVPPSTFTPLLANLACSDVSSWDLLLKGSTRKPRKVGLVYVKVVVSAQSTLKSWAQDSTDCVSVQKGKR